MIKFSRPQLIAFVRALDRHLQEPTTILIVGGAAASIGYNSGTETSDIDVLNILEGTNEDIFNATLESQEETGLDIDVAPASVAELPYNFEDRVKPVRGLDMQNLTLLIPDKYDLTLSKALRGYSNDIDAIEGIDREHPLSMKILVERFETELLDIANSEPRKIKLNVAMVVARLYGVEEGRKLAERWGVPVPRA